MLRYATMDVKYLPDAYYRLISESTIVASQLQPFVKTKQCQNYEDFYSNYILSKIFSESEKCLHYPYINKDIKDVEEIEPGQRILAFVK
jgi:hypothetical protein